MADFEALEANCPAEADVIMYGSPTVMTIHIVIAITLDMTQMLYSTLQICLQQTGVGALLSAFGNSWPWLSN